MKKIFIILSVLFSQFVFGQSKQTVITNVTLFDGEKTFENTNVVFQNGKIMDITDDIGKYSGAVLIDGKNKTIIPPLVNVHVHVWMPLNLKDAMKNGVFALLDMHTTDAYANTLREYNDSLNYAEYYSSNAGATVKGGHGTQYGIKVPIINDTVSAVQFVQDRIKNNADYIKILKEPLFPTLTASQTLEVIEETHRQNKIAVAHVTLLSNATELTAQSVDGFVHIWFDKPASEESLDSMKSKSIFIVPTLSVIEKVIQSGKSWIKNGLTFEKVVEEVKKAHNKGIPILAGTDAPNFGMNYTTQLYDEMLLLSEAGMNNTEVLKSATVNIYESFRLKNFGKLKKGSNASFMLISGNPLSAIEDIKNPKQIFKKGQQM